MKNQDNSSSQTQEPNQASDQVAPVEVPQGEIESVAEPVQPQVVQTEQTSAPAANSSTATETVSDVQAKIESVQPEANNRYYQYIGGGAWLPGLPARDLSEAEVKTSGYLPEDLIRSLYRLGLIGEAANTTNNLGDKPTPNSDKN